jgi:hypothetical protein
MQDEELPAALRPNRIPARRLGPFVGVRCARVESDHLDVVLAQQRDGDFGARVWAITHRPQASEPTRYADIYFYVYTYTYDERESPDTPVCSVDEDALADLARRSIP